MAEKDRAGISSHTPVSRLSKALSHTHLNVLDQEASPMQPPRLPGPPSSTRKRKLSKSQSLSGSQESLSSIVSEARVLVVNTGGTIGMMYQNEVLAPQANAFAKSLKKLPILHDEQYARETKLYDFHDFPENTLVLPLSKQNKRIVYTVLEYSPLLDSCNMTTDDWAKIAKDIEKYYEHYDGFVVLHGTDTMAYTASALSFMCENLGKTIVLTGSQVPIYEMRNDGRDNLLGALLIAGQFVIPEVCLYFHHKLYRGNRVTKVDAGSFNAFASPNLPPLANAEVDITINWETVWRANTMKKFHVHTDMNRNVGLLRIFPGITAATVKAFLQPPMEGIVLETYGTGNAPNCRIDLLQELKAATDRGVAIINCTQCLRGSVSESYATGKSLTVVGVIPGCDLTPEAALVKLSYVLGKTRLTLEQKTQELEAVRDALTPALACAAAKTGDVDALEAIRDMGANLSSEDYDGRTPLHVACCEGHYHAVQYLLNNGATVYAKDRCGDTPLMNAVKFRHIEVIKLLRQTGAHLSWEELEHSGTELCSLASIGDVEGLMAWDMAGVDMDQAGYDGQTPYQVAEAAGNEGVLEFFHQKRGGQIFLNGSTSDKES
ncbi:60 kDa lysophospholipase isoform X2 [Bufo gargarizans]|uniref:60 kDa lysophospholipase isoform X2 n=1 Tax=Bufo gargarizans TaxID=30331 RepID=UPI001CF1FE48|nr:60 kDa lysophospholipase isoform X2 [Bufo gargarizans]